MLLFVEGLHGLLDLVEFLGDLVLHFADVALEVVDLLGRGRGTSTVRFSVF